MHILFKQQKKLTLFLLGGFSLLAGFVLILTATIGAQPARASAEPTTHTHYITLNPNGGTGGLAGYHQVCGAFFKVPSEIWSPPTRAGYVFVEYRFDCWCPALGANGVVNGNCWCDGTNPSASGNWLHCGDATLYALWRLPNSSDHTVVKPPESGTGWVLVG